MKISAALCEYDFIFTAKNILREGDQPPLPLAETD